MPTDITFDRHQIGGLTIDEERPVITPVPASLPNVPVEVPLDALLVDMTDATGRMAVAMAVYEARGDEYSLRRGHHRGGLTWRGTPPPPSPPATRSVGRIVWYLTPWCSLGHIVFVADPNDIPEIGASRISPPEMDPEGIVPDPQYEHVPALADLDPNDPRLLPDGTRWVDAEALARVALHVLGGSDE